MSDDDANPIRRQQALNAQNSAEIVRLYEAMSSEQRRREGLVEHRCKRKGCTALFVWRRQDQLLVYLRQYRLRPRREESTSHPRARERLTSGDGRWPARGVLLADYAGLGPDVGLPVKCDHLDQVVVVPELLAEATAARRGEPVVRWW